MAIQLPYPKKEKPMSSDIQELAKLLANARSYSDLCQVMTTSGAVSGNVAGRLLAAIQDDARIRELGRYGVMGDSPSTERFQSGVTVSLPKP